MNDGEPAHPASARCALCGNRWIEEAAGFVGTAVTELVPPDAQLHLWNAQRELLLALAATIDHHTKHRRATADDHSPVGRRPSRVTVD